MKQHKGNIILMVLFILISASAFALLMMQYTESMFDHTRMTYDYNKAYYLANAGVELGLADSLDGWETHSYAIGYENTNPDISSVFSCEDMDCSASSTINARSKNHANNSENIDENDNFCTEKNVFKLKAGDSLAFPLFYLNQEKKVNTTPMLGSTLFTITPLWWLVNFHVGATVDNGNNSHDIALLTTINNNRFKLSDLKTTGTTPQSPSWKDGEYLVLINKWSDTSFCLTSDKEIPRQRLRVDGEWTFNDYSISLSAAKKVTLPGFLFSTSVWRE